MWGMRIEVDIEGVEPLRGQVGQAGEDPIVFSGWLGLLRQLERLAALAQPPSEGLGGELDA
jgi:hypothetical protein